MSIAVLFVKMVAPVMCRPPAPCAFRIPLFANPSAFTLITSALPPSARIVPWLSKPPEFAPSWPAPRMVVFAPIVVSVLLFTIRLFA